MPSDSRDAPPPVVDWGHRRRLRPLPEDALLLGQEGDRWLGLVLVWIDEREVAALCTGDYLGNVDFMPFVENGSLRSEDVLWWRPWAG